MQATVETVLKVSQKQQPEDVDDDNGAAESAATNSTDTSSPSIEKEKSAGKPSDKTHAPSGSKQPKSKGKNSHAEKEVDRIIDSQDNEYILSKPK